MHAARKLYNYLAKRKWMCTAAAVGVGAISLRFVSDLLDPNVVLDDGFCWAWRRDCSVRWAAVTAIASTAAVFAAVWSALRSARSTNRALRQQIEILEKGLQIDARAVAAPILHELITALSHFRLAQHQWRRENENVDEIVQSHPEIQPTTVGLAARAIQAQQSIEAACLDFTEKHFLSVAKRDQPLGAAIGIAILQARMAANLTPKFIDTTQNDFGLNVYTEIMIESKMKEIDAACKELRIAIDLLIPHVKGLGVGIPDMMLVEEPWTMPKDAD